MCLRAMARPCRRGSSGVVVVVVNGEDDSLICRPRSSRGLPGLVETLPGALASRSPHPWYRTYVVPSVGAVPPVCWRFRP